MSKVGADRSSTFSGNGSGTINNVNAYVIDSGIATESDLNVVNFITFIDTKNTDCDAVAAGNSGADACNSLPARIGFKQNGVAKGIIATAAIGRYLAE